MPCVMAMTKRKKIAVTKSNLLDVFEYRRETGELFWKKPTGNRVHVGDKAGSILNQYGTPYLCLRLNGKNHLNHRLIWLIEKGQLPKFEIDHIDGDGLNNRIENLRDVPGKVNAKNGSKRADNVSGITGVGWNKAMRGWMVQIQSGGKNIYVECVKCHCIEKAIQIRKKASEAYGFHPNHGRAK